MKVLHVIPGIATRYGGPTTTIRALCSAVHRLPNVEIELATTDADGVAGRLDAASLPTDYQVHLFPRTASEQWKYSHGLGRWLRTHVGRFDLLHSHALWSYSAGAASRAAQRTGIPYVVRPAGMLSQYALGHHAWRKRLYWHLAEHRNLARAVRFHATSEDEASDIRDLCPGTPVSIIPNGVEEEAWAAPESETSLRTKCGSRCGRLPILLFVGRNHPIKGITDLLLPALAAMNSKAFLACVGGPDDRAPGYEREILRTAKRLAVDDRMALLGPVERTERWAVFDGAAAFVLPSHSENFGIVAAEAMARGCPVVVTDTVQSCAHVSASGAGRVVPRNVMDMARALDEIVSDAALQQSSGQAGRSYANSHFRWDGIAVKVEQMYRECLAAA